MLLLLLACGGTSPTHALDPGEWTLQGEAVSGILQVVGDRCFIGIWGPSFRTGETEVECHSFREGERITLDFGLEFGAGAATATAWTTPEMEQLTLPLGSREGEYELVLRLTEQLPSSEVLNNAIKNAAEGLAASKSMWDRSVFRIVDDTRLVGELYLPTERPPEIQLYSPWWMTRGRVKATLTEKGPDLWLSFEIMPSLDAESGLVIINRATNQLVLPIADRPLPGEMRFQLEEGEVTQEMRDAAVASALREGLERERVVMEPLAKKTQRLAQSRNCPPWSVLQELEPEIATHWKGYSVRSEKEGGNCAIKMDARPAQQGRSLSIRVNKDGVVESTNRPFEF